MSKLNDRDAELRTVLSPYEIKELQWLVAFADADYDDVLTNVLTTLHGC